MCVSRWLMTSRILAPEPERTARAAISKVVRLPVGESDRALVACLRSDPKWGQLALFDRYAVDVERVLFRLLGWDPDLTDLLQDVFVTAITSIDTLRDERALGSWLVGISVHKARQLIRRRRFRRLVEFVAPLELPDCEAATSSQEVSDALRRTYQVLNRLRTEDRIAFVLRRVEGMGLAAIAEATKVSLATVKRRLSRAQRRFVTLARKDEVLAEWLKHGTLKP